MSYITEAPTDFSDLPSSDVDVQTSQSESEDKRVAADELMEQLNLEFP